jgi:threonine dehydrogenase-like Zn-dependent dehydrogenase
LNIREMPEPEPGLDEVLIKVAYSGICGSELGGYLGENSLRHPPLVMGHEFSGEIVGLGSNAAHHKPGLAVGQQVTVNPLIHCGWCRACLAGRFNLCRSREILGIHRPGSFADLVKAPAALVYPLPPSMSLEHAALAEPAGCAVRAVRLGGCAPGTSLLVTGLGPIGLLVALVARTFGVTEIFATDTDPDWRMSGEQLGFLVLNPLEDDVIAATQAATGNLGVDAAIDAVGLTVTRRQCIDAVARGGRVIFVGLHEADSEIQGNDIIRKETRIEGSFAYAPLDFDEAFNWLSDGHIQKLDPWLIKAPLGEGQGCFERLLSKPGPVAKILLYS